MPCASAENLDTTWHVFDDEEVKGTSKSPLDSLPPLSTPYVLFYQKLGAEGPSQDDVKYQRSMQMLVEMDNSRYLQQNGKDGRKNAVSKASSFWKKDDEDQPPPSCGGDSSFMETPQFVF